MDATQNEKLFYGSQVKILKRTKEFNIYELKNEAGYAIMKSYHLFDGIDLIYNDINMNEISNDLCMPPGFFEVNHCQEGRIECEFNRECLYMTKDDFSINRKDGTCHKSYFPLSHYYGISICINIKKAQIEIDRYFESNFINIKSLCDKLCGESGFLLMKSNESIGHIFAELYSIPEKIKFQYFKIKVLEVILFLSTLDGNNNEKRSYYSKRQVDKIKDIQKYITKNIEKKYTLDELSENYNIGLTTMKQCFKGVYGENIYSYIRRFRMELAAEKLMGSDNTILEIANSVGYENGSKFAAAFKNVIGISPKKFRTLKNKKEVYNYTKITE